MTVERTLVVLPSYNEKTNIIQLIEKIFSLGNQFDVCVVDDQSPDGTADTIRDFQSTIDEQERARLQLIVRDKKDGRGSAVREGLLWGLNRKERNYVSFVEMDCDFSHPPTDIPKGVELLNSSDVVMGCRYPNGTIVGWPLTRRVFSWFANLLAKTLISWSIPDYTNGFRFYGARAAQFICEKQQKHKGYIYLSETISYFLQNNFKFDIFPILFVNRERGVSNTNLNEIFNALKGIFSIAWDYHLRRQRN